MKGNLRIRRAKSSDLDRLAEIHAASYPDSRNLSSRLDRFTRNPFGTIEDVRVAEVGGQLVGHAFLFHMHLAFGGRLVPTAAIATVGIAPEARGEGHATRLIEALHTEAIESGAAIAVLHAFRHGFYRRLGYVSASPMVRCVVAPEAFSPERTCDVRAARKGDRRNIERCYAGILSARTGWLKRPLSLWDDLFMNERLFFSVAVSSDPSRQILGYVAWSIEQEEAHAESTVRVRELVAPSLAVERELFSVFARMRDQVSRVEVDLPIDSPWLQAFGDGAHPEHGTSTFEHPIGRIGGGPMVRILDTARALSLRGYGKLGTLSLSVGAAKAPWTISNRREGAVVSSKATPGALRLSEEGLALLLFGGMSLSHAELMGHAQARSRQTRSDAESMLRGPAYHSIDPF